MSLEKQTEALKAKILDCFSGFPAPDKDQISPCACWECKELRETFAGLDWKIIDAKVIEDNFCQIPLFSSEAYRYFLPAFLLYVLDNFDPDSLVFEFTVYALCPSTEEHMKQYWRERLQTFTEPQMNVLYEFLELIRKQPETYDYYKEIDRAKNRLVSYRGNNNG